MTHNRLPITQKPASNPNPKPGSLLPELKLLPVRQERTLVLERNLAHHRAYRLASAPPPKLRQYDDRPRVERIRGFEV